MTESALEGWMYRIISLKGEINRVASRLIQIEYGVFAPSSLEMPRLSPPELGFIRTVSWLFVNYFEVGKIGIDFLESRFLAYGSDADGRHGFHRSLVRRLRTFLQHNLDSTKQWDKGIQDDCEHWLEGQCGTPIPGDDGHWEKCLSGLLSEATLFMDALLQTVRSIERDESLEQIRREWLFRLERFHPPHEFDGLISAVAADMGREHVDAERLRNRFYDQWTQALSLLEPDCDFETEARKLIEHSLLTSTAAVLPITGKDLIEELNLAPGPQIGELLEQGRKIYESRPCSRDMLLEQLAKTLAAREHTNNQEDKALR